MHDGNMYALQEDTLLCEQHSQRSSDVAPTLESRLNLYSHYTDFPLVNLRHDASRISQMMVGETTVYVIPEICIENQYKKAVEAWNNRQVLFKDGSFTSDEESYILQVLIAAGANSAKKQSIVGESIFVHDREPGVTYIKSKKGDKNYAFFNSKINNKFNAAIFSPTALKLMNDKISRAQSKSMK